MVNAKKENRIIPTYIPRKANDLPMFFENKPCQGASGRLYPLPFSDGISDDKSDVSYEVYTLENEYVKTEVVPALGGKILRGHDKQHDFDFIYYNEVVKPALVGLAGCRDDALDLFAKIEYSHLADVPGELAQYTVKPENFIDVACDYMSAGLYEDALYTLSLAGDGYPLNHYYRGYCQAKLGRDGSAAIALAESMDTGYCFPARLEDIAVLEYAIEVCGGANACYYLGSLYYDRFCYEEAAAPWQRAVELDPTHGKAWRNLSLYWFDKKAEAIELARVKRFHIYEGGEGKLIKQHAWMHVLYGLELAKAGMDAEAEQTYMGGVNMPKSYGEAKTFFNQEAHIFYCLGLLKEKLGLENDAKAAFEKAAEYKAAVSEISAFRALALQKLGLAQQAQTVIDEMHAAADNFITNKDLRTYYGMGPPPPCPLSTTSKSRTSRQAGA